MHPSRLDASHGNPLFPLHRALAMMTLEEEQILTRRLEIIQLEIETIVQFLCSREESDMATIARTVYLVIRQLQRKVADKEKKLWKS